LKNAANEYVKKCREKYINTLLTKLPGFLMFVFETDVTSRINNIVNLVRHLLALNCIGYYPVPQPEVEIVIFVERNGKNAHKASLIKEENLIIFIIYLILANLFSLFFLFTSFRTNKTSFLNAKKYNCLLSRG